MTWEWMNKLHWWVTIFTPWDTDVLCDAVNERLRETLCMTNKLDMLFFAWGNPETLKLMWGNSRIGLKYITEKNPSLCHEWDWEWKYIDEILFQPLVCPECIEKRGRTFSFLLRESKKYNDFYKKGIKKHKRAVHMSTYHSERLIPYLYCNIEDEKKLFSSEGGRLDQMVECTQWFIWSFKDILWVLWADPLFQSQFEHLESIMSSYNLNREVDIIVKELIEGYESSNNPWYANDYLHAFSLIQEEFFKLGALIKITGLMDDFSANKWECISWIDQEWGYLHWKSPNESPKNSVESQSIPQKWAVVIRAPNALWKTFLAEKELLLSIIYQSTGYTLAENYTSHCYQKILWLYRDGDEPWENLSALWKELQNLDKLYEEVISTRWPVKIFLDEIGSTTDEESECRILVSFLTTLASRSKKQYIHVIISTHNQLLLDFIKADEVLSSLCSFITLNDDRSWREWERDSETLGAFEKLRPQLSRLTVDWLAELNLARVNEDLHEYLRKWVQMFLDWKRWDYVFPSLGKIGAKESDDTMTWWAPWTIYFSWYYAGLPYLTEHASGLAIEWWRLKGDWGKYVVPMFPYDRYIDSWFCVDDARHEIEMKSFPVSCSGVLCEEKLISFLWNYCPWVTQYEVLRGSRFLLSFLETDVDISVRVIKKRRQFINELIKNEGLHQDMRLSIHNTKYFLYLLTILTSSSSSLFADLPFIVDDACSFMDKLDKSLVLFFDSCRKRQNLFASTVNWFDRDIIWEIFENLGYGGFKKDIFEKDMTKIILEKLKGIYGSEEVLRKQIIERGIISMFERVCDNISYEENGIPKSIWGRGVIFLLISTLLNGQGSIERLLSIFSSIDADFSKDMGQYFAKLFSTVLWKDNDGSMQYLVTQFKQASITWKEACTNYERDGIRAIWQELEKLLSIIELAEYEKQSWSIDVEFADKRVVDIRWMINQNPLPVEEEDSSDNWKTIYRLRKDDVPNDVYLDEENPVEIITGFNAWWKSTYIRNLRDALMHAWRIWKIRADSATIWWIENIGYIWRELVEKSEFSSWELDIINWLALFEYAKDKDFMIIDIDEIFSTMDKKYSTAFAYTFVGKLIEMWKFAVIVSHNHDFVEEISKLDGVKCSKFDSSISADWEVVHRYKKSPWRIACSNGIKVAKGLWFWERWIDEDANERVTSFLY